MLAKIGINFNQSSLKNGSHHRSTTSELSKYCLQQIPLLNFNDENSDIQNKINHSNRSMKKQKSDFIGKKKFMHESVKPAINQHKTSFFKEDNIKYSIR